MGIVIDPEEAKRSECTCYRIEGKEEVPTPEKVICFTDGIIGTLSDKQDKKYCKKKVVKPQKIKIE